MSSVVTVSCGNKKKEVALQKLRYKSASVFA